MLKRTKYCGLYREADIGETAVACGWVQTKRDMGGVIFVDLRDREGVLQVVFNAAKLSPEEFAAADKLKNETVIAVKGPICRDRERKAGHRHCGTACGAAGGDQRGRPAALPAG